MQSRGDWNWFSCHIQSGLDPRQQKLRDSSEEDDSAQWSQMDSECVSSTVNTCINFYHLCFHFYVFHRNAPQNGAVDLKGNNFKLLSVQHFKISALELSPFDWHCPANREKSSWHKFSRKRKTSHTGPECFLPLQRSRSQSQPVEHCEEAAPYHTCPRPRGMCVCAFVQRKPSMNEHSEGWHVHQQNPVSYVNKGCEYFAQPFFAMFFFGSWKRWLSDWFWLAKQVLKKRINNRSVHFTDRSDAILHTFVTLRFGKFWLRFAVFFIVVCFLFILWRKTSYFWFWVCIVFKCSPPKYGPWIGQALL